MRHSLKMDLSHDGCVTLLELSFHPHGCGNVAMLQELIADHYLSDLDFSLSMRKGEIFMIPLSCNDNSKKIT